MERKFDPSKNGDAERLAAEHKSVERALCPLRINNRTTIYVPKEKFNEEYRRKWMKKHKVQDQDRMVRSLNVGKDRIKIKKEDLMKYAGSGVTVNRIAMETGYSVGCIYTKLREWKIKIKET